MPLWFVVLHQRLPRFAPLLWKHGELRAPLQWTNPLALRRLPSPVAAALKAPSSPVASLAPKPEAPPRAFQNDGPLSGFTAASGEAAGPSDADFGFQRPDFGRDPLVGTVQEYDRHVFLCYKTPYVWPSHVEAPESDRLPRLVSAALATRMLHIKHRVILLFCELKGLPFLNASIAIAIAFNFPV